MISPRTIRKIRGHSLATVELSEYADCAKYREIMGRGNLEVSDSWAGGSWDDCDRALAGGAPPAEFEALVDRINTDLGVSTDGTELAYAPAGGCVSVARHLAGNPMCMGRMVESNHEHAPIRVFIEGGTSGGIDERHVANRMAACVALVMALAKVRPVELWYVDLANTDTPIDGCLMVRMGTTPLDMSAVAGMASTPFTRLFGYSVIKHVATGNANYPTGMPWSKIPLAEAVGATATDVVVPGLRKYDDAACFNNPVAWVQDQLTKALAGTGLAHHEGY